MQNVHQIRFQHADFISLLALDFSLVVDKSILQQKRELPKKDLINIFGGPFIFGVYLQFVQNTISKQQKSGIILDCKRRENILYQIKFLIFFKFYTILFINVRSDYHLFLFKFCNEFVDRVSYGGKFSLFCFRQITDMVFDTGQIIVHVSNKSLFVPLRFIKRGVLPAGQNYFDRRVPDGLFFRHYFLFEYRSSKLRL